MESNKSTNISPIQTVSTYENILNTPPDYATPKEIDDLLSEKAHEKRINEIMETYNYKGTATSGDKMGTITIPTPPITFTQSGSNAPYTHLSESQNRYNEMLDKGTISPRSINETHLTLSDVFKYIKEASEDTQGKPPKIYADRIASEIYKKGKYSKPETENRTDALTTYLDFFEKTGLLEKEATTLKHNLTKDTHHYAINEKLLHQYNHAHKQATSAGIDNMTTLEANELFLNYLDQEKLETWKAYH